MRFPFPRLPGEFEIPDEWLTEAGMTGFTPSASAYPSTDPAARAIPLRDIEAMRCAAPGAIGYSGRDRTAENSRSSVGHRAEEHFTPPCVSGHLTLSAAVPSPSPTSRTALTQRARCSQRRRNCPAGSLSIVRRPRAALRPSPLSGAWRGPLPADRWALCLAASSAGCADAAADGTQPELARLAAPDTGSGEARRDARRDRATGSCPRRRPYPARRHHVHQARLAQLARMLLTGYRQTPSTLPIALMFACLP